MNADIYFSAGRIRVFHLLEKCAAERTTKKPWKVRDEFSCTFQGFLFDAAAWLQPYFTILFGMGRAGKPPLALRFTIS